MTDDPLNIRRKFHMGTGRTGHKELRDGRSPDPLPVAKGHIPRISQLMALAIQFEQLIRDGVVKDQADIARLAFVTRARVSQIMDLLTLAPDIQEALLFLPLVTEGREQIKLADMQPVIASMKWSLQREQWDAIVAARL